MYMWVDWLMKLSYQLLKTSVVGFERPCSPKGDLKISPLPWALPNDIWFRQIINRSADFDEIKYVWGVLKGVEIFWDLLLGEHGLSKPIAIQRLRRRGSDVVFYSLYSIVFLDFTNRTESLFAVVAMYERIRMFIYDLWTDWGIWKRKEKRVIVG